MDTFIANLKHAVRNKETVSIGGGEFSHTELKAVAAKLEAAQAAQAALQEISKMLARHPEANTGNSVVHYCLCQARNAVRGAR